MMGLVGTRVVGWWGLGWGGGLGSEVLGIGTREVGTG